MLVRFILAFGFLCSVFFSTAEDVRIGLFRYYNISSLQITHFQGKYEVQADSTRCRDIEKGISYNLVVSSGKIKLLRGASVIGVFDTIQITDLTGSGIFKIKPIVPSKRERQYKGGLFITTNGKFLTIVNQVEMADYLGGVIESEGGGGRHLEYYKVQAILSRTYAIRNKGRHRKEGFGLCDRVHCQAYHHRLKHTPKIDEAVQATRNEVMTDSNFYLAQGYFHANCGGQTSESHYVWNKSITYLWSVVDTFCIKTKQATWTKKISKSKWRTYLVKHFGFPVNDSTYSKYLYQYKPKEREAFYVDQKLGIPLRDIREKFRLKSTYFSTSLEGDFVVLKGRGFGHGIGLCQEGAMNMAKAGYSYRQILKFYFQGIVIGDYHQLLYFRENEHFE